MWQVLIIYLSAHVHNAKTHDRQLHATKLTLPMHYNMPQHPNKAVEVFRHMKKDLVFFFYARTQWL